MVDFQGEHKIGHDPRGTAVDVQAVEINKWRTNAFSGQVAYQGVQSSLRLDLQSTRWSYTNNNLDPLFGRLSNLASVSFTGAITAKTSLVGTVSVSQQIYDQNKNLDNSIYTFGTGARWQVSDLTAGEILFGYQFLRFSNAQVSQPGPALSQFTRDKDSASSFYVVGNLNWTPTSYLNVSFQPYRTIQQSVVLGTLFFVATGANVAVSHNMSDRVGVTLNLGIENDKFTGGSSLSAGVNQERTDTIKNAAMGISYRAMRYLGIGLQYAYEDRTSTQGAFVYTASTVMLSLQGGF